MEKNNDKYNIISPEDFQPSGYCDFSKIYNPQYANFKSTCMTQLIEKTAIVENNCIKEFTYIIPNNYQAETEIYTDSEFNKKNISRFWSYDEEYNTLTKLKCLNCGNFTSYGVMINCDYENIYHYECFECYGYYAVCFDCENPNANKVHLAKLLSHHNFYNLTDNEDYYKIVPDDNYEEDPDDKYEEDSTMIHYTKPVYFFDQKKFGELTGPDGGYVSVWKCKCSTRVINDK